MFNLIDLIAWLQATQSNNNNMEKPSVTLPSISKELFNSESIEQAKDYLNKQLSELQQKNEELKDNEELQRELRTARFVPTNEGDIKKKALKNLSNEMTRVTQALELVKHLEEAKAQKKNVWAETVNFLIANKLFTRKNHRNKVTALYRSWLECSDKDERNQALEFYNDDFGNIYPECKLLIINVKRQWLSSHLEKEANIVNVSALFHKMFIPIDVTATILALIKKKVSNSDIVKTNLLQKLIVDNSSFIDKPENDIKETIDLLSKYPEADEFLKFAETQILEIKPYYFSLAGKTIVNPPTADRVFNEIAPFNFTRDEENFKNLSSLFGSDFLSCALKIKYVGDSAEWFKNQFKAYLNQPQQDMAQIVKLVQLVSRDSSTEESEVLAVLLEKPIISYFASTNNTVIFSLARHNRMIIDLFFPDKSYAAIQKKLQMLVRGQSLGEERTLMDAFSELIGLYEGLRAITSQGDEAVFLEILELSLQHAPVDELIILFLKHKLHLYEHKIRKCFDDLSAQFDQDVAGSLGLFLRAVCESSEEVDVRQAISTFQAIEDSWFDLHKKINLICAIDEKSFVNPLPRDKYFLRVKLFQQITALEKNISIKNFLRCTEAKLKSQVTSVGERTLIHLLPVIKCEKRIREVFELLEESKKNMGWLTHQYGEVDVLTLLDLLEVDHSSPHILITVIKDYKKEKNISFSADIVKTKFNFNYIFDEINFKNLSSIFGTIFLSRAIIFSATRSIYGQEQELFANGQKLIKQNLIASEIPDIIKLLANAPEHLDFFGTLLPLNTIKTFINEKEPIILALAPAIPQIFDLFPENDAEEYLNLAKYDFSMSSFILQRFYCGCPTITKQFWGISFIILDKLSAQKTKQIRSTIYGKMLELSLHNMGGENSLEKILSTEAQSHVDILIKHIDTLYAQFDNFILDRRSGFSQASYSEIKLCFTEISKKINYIKTLGCPVSNRLSLSEYELRAYVFNKFNYEKVVIGAKQFLEIIEVQPTKEFEAGDFEKSLIHLLPGANHQDHIKEIIQLLNEISQGRLWITYQYNIPEAPFDLSSLFARFGTIESVETLFSLQSANEQIFNELIQATFPQLCRNGRLDAVICLWKLVRKQTSSTLNFEKLIGNSFEEAAEFGSMDVVKFLLESETSLVITDTFLSSAFSLATEQKQWKTVSFLFDKFNGRGNKNPLNQTQIKFAIEKAAQNEEWALVQKLAKWDDQGIRSLAFQQLIDSKKYQEATALSQNITSLELSSSQSFTLFCNVMGNYNETLAKFILEKKKDNFIVADVLGFCKKFFQCTSRMTLESPEVLGIIKSLLAKINVKDLEPNLQSQFDELYIDTLDNQTTNLTAFLYQKMDFSSPETQERINGRLDKAAEQSNWPFVFLLNGIPHPKIRILNIDLTLDNAFKGKKISIIRELCLTNKESQPTSEQIHDRIVQYIGIPRRQNDDASIKLDIFSKKAKNFLMCREAVLKLSTYAATLNEAEKKKAEDISKNLLTLLHNYGTQYLADEPSQNNYIRSKTMLEEALSCASSEKASIGLGKNDIEWEQILINIALAMTVIGIVVIAINYYRNNSFYFYAPRPNPIKEIEENFNSIINAQ